MKPEKAYLICGTNCAGSSILCDALSSSCVAGRPDNYFSHLEFSEPEKYLKELELGIQHITDSNGVFATKILDLEILGCWCQALNGSDIWLTQLLGRDKVLRSLLPDLRYLFIRRKDKVRQAVSLARVRHMDNYCSTQRLTPKIANELVFQIEVLDKLILEIETLEKEWEEYFEINEIKPFTVYYEDLAADFDETLLGVFDFLDFNYDFKAKVLKVDLEKQSDENDEELIVTYRGAKKAEEVYNNMPLAKKHLLGQIVDEELEKTENSPIKQDYQHLLGFDFSPQEAKYRIVCHLAQHLNLDT